MSGNPPAQHLLFDLDGTLIDGVDDLVISLNVVLEQAGLLPVSRPQLLAMLGDGMRMVVKRAFAAQGITLDDATLERHTTAFLAAYQHTGYRHTRLFAGVKATLSALHGKGWRIGLASNKFTEPCREILQRLDILPLFAAVAGGDAAGVRKPDPGHLRHTLQLMGFDAARGDRAVMVG
ncbi:MAG TPA: HAD hydrolase-like protein, partial [Hyphomicrobiales bacterium]|nr:HAD hydrolase-like protein [Hyphomicrobiales bacterium]